jgi:hypothetical protein
MDRVACAFERPATSGDSSGSHSSLEKELTPGTAKATFLDP